MTRDGVDSWVTYEELDEDERTELAALEAQVSANCPKTQEGWIEWDLQHPGRREELLAVCGITPKTIFNGLEPQTPEEFEQLEAKGFHDLANFWRWHQQQQNLSPVRAEE